MAMLPPIYTLLSAASSVTTLIGTPPRAYRHGRAPQSVVAPYVTWDVPASAPERQLTGVPLADRCNVRVDCWADDDTQVETLAQAVRDALEPTSESLGIVVDERDATTNRYRLSLSFEFWLLR